MSDLHHYDDEELRRQAFAIAYRMLGSVSEAEDVVQEALLRVHRTLARGEPIEVPRAYVTTVATRLAIDELRSARMRRETYIGEWLPEPLITDPAADPAIVAETNESLSLAFLVLLESLTPEQRAVLLLREVFDYGYEEIAAIVGKTEANARQIAARARTLLGPRRPRFETSPEHREELARRFFAAARDGDLASLEQLLADDVVLHGDGGGKVPALARSLVGRGRVARTLLAWARHAPASTGFAVRRVEVNGAPGAMLFDPRVRLISVIALDVRDGQVHGVNSIVNPDKLRHLGPVADLADVLQKTRTD